MNYRIILILLIGLIVYSCFQKKTIDKSQIEETLNQKHDQKTGLQFENGPTRGQYFHDSTGLKQGLIYIKTTITNDSTTAINLQIELDEEYEYPNMYGKEKFNLIILPNIFTLDRTEITDSILNNLLKTNSKQFFRKTLKPNETCVLSIGVLRASKPELCSATPYALMEYSDQRSYSDCDVRKEKTQLNREKPFLGIKVGFCTVGGDYESCTIIPCGKISYSKEHE